MDGKAAIITGSSRGIGRATALLFAQEGARVAVNYVQGRAAAEQVVSLIEDGGGRAIAVRADVTSREQVYELVTTVMERFGRIDVLVNNAGANSAGSVLTTDDATLDALLAVNLKGVINCVQAVAPSMMQQRAGRILNIASIAGIGTALADTSAYAITKAAVIALTKRLALELGSYRINVNAICPGVILTDMARASLGETRVTAMAAKAIVGRVGIPEDVAQAALFLTGDESSFITAQVLTVDGGRMDFLSRSG
jgi:3-oxoacyl-[acyl-carrier protein] reductase